MSSRSYTIKINGLHFLSVLEVDALARPVAPKTRSVFQYARLSEWAEVLTCICMCLLTGICVLPVGEAGTVRAARSRREHACTILEHRTLARAVREARGIEAHGGRGVRYVGRLHIPALISHRIGLAGNAK